MLIADVRLKGTLKGDAVLDVLDTEDLVMEQCSIKDLELLEKNGITITNVTQVRNYFMKSTENVTYSVTPIKSISLIVGGIQVIKVNNKLLYVFFEDSSYIELKVSSLVLYLNDRTVSVCESIGLPYLKDGILFLSYYTNTGIRNAVALDKCQAQKNGINKKRQLLLHAR